MAHIQVGVVAANGNVQAWFQGCNTNNGTYANMTGANTFLSSTSNTEGTLELRADQLPAGNQFVQLNILVSVANALVSAAVFCGESNYKPASSQDGGNSTTLQRLVM